MWIGLRRRKTSTLAIISRNKNECPLRNVGMLTEWEEKKNAVWTAALIVTMKPLRDEFQTWRKNYGMALWIVGVYTRVQWELIDERERAEDGQREWKIKVEERERESTYASFITDPLRRLKPCMHTLSAIIITKSFDDLQWRPIYYKFTVPVNIPHEHNSPNIHISIQIYIHFTDIQ